MERNMAKNWAGNLEYAAARILEPTSVDELCGMVRACEKVRPLGTRHSFNAVADCPGGDLVSLKHLDAVLGLDGLDTGRPTVRVQGGVTYGQLCPWLDAQGWALHNLASLPHIGIAGACATATHGSGDGHANLADAVTALKIVNPEGELVEVSAEADRERFGGMVVALGCLGPVAELTLRIEPRYDVTQRVYQYLPLVSLRENFDDITAAATSVSLFTDWKNQTINQVWLKQRVGGGDGSADQAPFFGATPATQNLHPLPELSPECCTEQRGVPGPWHERLPHFRLEFTPSHGQELQSEYLVPRHHAVAAIEKMFAMHDQFGELVQVSEIRTVAAGRQWMSPCYQQPCVGIHFTWVKDQPAVMALLPEIERALAPFAARPHWGKLFAMDRKELTGLYGQRLDHFRGLVHEFDPNRKFRDGFVQKQIFG